MSGFFSPAASNTLADVLGEAVNEIVLAAVRLSGDNNWLCFLAGLAINRGLLPSAAPQLSKCWWWRK